MLPNHRTCSNCNYWSDITGVINGIVVAGCMKDIASRSLMPASTKVTQGSYSCSKWGKIKYAEFYNAMSDKVKRIRDRS